MLPNDLKNLKSYMFQNGHNHFAVKVIKTFLNSNQRTSITNLKPDNSFDANTEKALADFQKSKSLIPTGRMDIKTWLAIGAEMNLIQINLVSMSDQTVRDLLTLGYRSKFPFRNVNPKNPSGISGFVKKKSLNLGNNITGDFSFRVFVAVFAPFDWFGPLKASKGDGNSRRFGNDPFDSYRLQAESKMTASPGNHTYPWSVTQSSAPTTSYLLRPSSIPTGIIGVTVPTVKLAEAKSEGIISDEDTDEVQPNGLHREGDSIRYHFQGNDDAFALWGDNSLLASDIDVHADISFKYDYYSRPNSYLMEISGKITGDQFPAVETYALDRIGNGVMLGVWQVSKGDGPVFMRDGKLGLPGNKQLPMIDINVSVIVENGLFADVQKNGRIISLVEHNKRFTDLPPVKPGGFRRRGQPIPAPHPTPTPQK